MCSSDLRRIGRPDDLGDLAVAGHQAFAAIYNEHKEIRVGDGSPSPVEDELVQRVLARPEHAAGVDQLEAQTAPLDVLGDDVAGRAGDGRDDGPARFAQTIEERGLAHIWAADEDHRGPMPSSGLSLWLS